MSFAAPGPEVAVYVISVAAELSGLHPQTLRAYERMGLVSPGRTGGGGRRYSHRDIERLRMIADLTSSGVGVEGVRRLLDLEQQIADLHARNRALVAELDATREALRRVRRCPPRAGDAEQAAGAARCRPHPVGGGLAPYPVSVPVDVAG